MATTVQQITDAAVQRSALNNPDLVPNAQVIRYINNFQKKVYVDAARVNPDFFGKEGTSATRADNTESWDLSTTPGDVGAVSLVTVATIVGTPPPAVDDEINLVSRRFPQIELSPRAYIRGKELSALGDELGDSGTDYVESVNVFYSELPTDISAMSDAVALPDEWADLIILPLARVLALRDRRADEAQVINQEFNFVYESFIAHAGTFDHGANRPLVAVPASGPIMRGGGGQNQR